MLDLINRLAKVIYGPAPGEETPADKALTFKILLAGVVIGLAILAGVPLYYWWSSMAEARSPAQAAAIGKATWTMLAVGLGIFLVRIAPLLIRAFWQQRRPHD